MLIVFLTNSTVGLGRWVEEEEDDEDGAVAGGSQYFRRPRIGWSTQSTEELAAIQPSDQPTSRCVNVQLAEVEEAEEEEQGASNVREENKINTTNK